MKESKLLSTFPGGSMRLGTAGRKRAVKHVELHFTHPQPTVWGAEYRKIRMSFRTADGKNTDLELTDIQFWSFLSWADDASAQPEWVDEASAQKIGAASYAEVRRTGKRGKGFRQVREALRAAGGE